MTGASTLSADEKQRYRRAVFALPPLTRTVFLLLRIYDLSTRQIADRLGIDIAGVEGCFAEALFMIDDFLSGKRPMRFDCAQCGIDIARAEAQLHRRYRWWLTAWRLRRGWPLRPVRPLSFVAWLAHLGSRS